MLSNPIPTHPEKPRVNERARFFQVTASAWAAMLTGSAFGFGIFSDHMKNEYSIGQSNLNLISTLASARLLSLPAGPLYDYLGGRPVMAFATFFSAAGFLCLALSFQEILPPTTLFFAIENLLMNTGGTWMDISYTLPNMFAFPLNRGTIIALLKPFTGLQPTILVVLYHAFMREKYVAYCYFNAIWICVGGVIGTVFIATPPFCQTGREKGTNPLDPKLVAEWQAAYMKRPATKWRLALGFMWQGAFLVFLSVVSFLSAYVSVTKEGSFAIGCLCVAFLFGPFVMCGFKASPFRCCGEYFGAEMIEADDEESLLISEQGETVPSAENIVAQDSAEGAEKYAVANVEDENFEFVTREAFAPPEKDADDPDLARDEHADEGSDVNVENNEVPVRVLSMRGATVYSSLYLKKRNPDEAPIWQIQTTFWQNMLTAIFWATWFTTGLAVWSTGHVLMMNVTQIYRALNGNTYDAAGNSLLIACIGLGSALGGILNGALDMICTRQNFHGTATYWISPALMTLTWILITFLPVSVLFIPTVIGAMSYGACWASSAILIRQLYAVDPGKHYIFLQTGAMVGTLCWNWLVFGGLYDKEAKKQGLFPYCSGFQCIAISTYFFIALNLVATASAVWVHFLWINCEKAAAEETAEEDRKRRAEILEGLQASICVSETEGSEDERKNAETPGITEGKEPNE